MKNEALKIIIAFVSGFFVAQFLKLIIGLLNKKDRKIITKSSSEFFRYLVKSGGMPSGHAASTVATAICVGLSSGFDSVVFGLAVSVCLIVLYDALNVRYAVGEQGKLLNLITKRNLKVVEGHNFFQVLIGAIIGAAIGWAVYIIF